MCYLHDTGHFRCSLFAPMGKSERETAFRVSFNRVTFRGTIPDIPDDSRTKIMTRRNETRAKSRQTIRGERIIVFNQRKVIKDYAGILGIDERH